MSPWNTLVFLRITFRFHVFMTIMFVWVGSIHSIMCCFTYGFKLTSCIKIVVGSLCVTLNSWWGISCYGNTSVRLEYSIFKMHLMKMFHIWHQWKMRSNWTQFIIDDILGITQILSTTPINDDVFLNWGNGCTCFFLTFNCCKKYKPSFHMLIGFEVLNPKPLFISLKFCFKEAVDGAAKIITTDLLMQNVGTNVWIFLCFVDLLLSYWSLEV